MVNEMRRQSRPYVYLEGDIDYKALDYFSLNVRNGGNRVATKIHLTTADESPIWIRRRMEGPRLTDFRGERVLLSQAFESDIPSLAPNESRQIGFVNHNNWNLGNAVRARYQVRYSDGAGTDYAESLEIDYQA